MQGFGCVSSTIRTSQELLYLRTKLLKVQLHVLMIGFLTHKHTLGLDAQISALPLTVFPNTKVGPACLTLSMHGTALTEQRGL